MGYKMKLKLCAGLIAIISTITISNPAIAQENVKRFSLEVGGGLDVILPFVSAQVSYRLPVMNDKVAVFADYSPINLLGESAPMQSSIVGMKYYFNETVLKSYFDLGAGIGFRYGVAPVPGHDTSNLLVPVIIAGIGTDLMVTDNFGISFEANASYPFILRGKGSLKVVF